MYIIITRIPHFIRGRPKERTNQLNAFAELTRPVHKTIHRSRCVPARPVECRVALRCRLAKWSHKIFDKYEAIWASLMAQTREDDDDVVVDVPSERQTMGGGVERGRDVQKQLRFKRIVN